MEDSHRQCEFSVGAMLPVDSDEYERVEIAERFTELHSHENPFVSTTESLKTALQYARSAASAENRPYITGIAPRGDRRVISFASHLTFGRKAKLNKEWAFVGHITPEDVKFRIYLDELTGKTKREIADYQAGRKLSFEGCSRDLAGAEVLYSPKFTCPQCAAPLPVYFKRWLGGEIGNIAVVDDKRLKISIFRQEEDTKIELSRRPFQIEDILAENGRCCCCWKCGSWLQNAGLHRDNLVEVRLPRLSRNARECLVSNNGWSSIVGIWLGLHCDRNGKLINLIKKIGLGPGWSIQPNTSLQVFGLGRWADSFMQHLIVRRALRWQIAQAPKIIAPNETRRLPVTCLSETESLQAVSVFRVLFESGESWSPDQALAMQWDETR